MGKKFQVQDKDIDNLIYKFNNNNNNNNNV